VAYDLVSGLTDDLMLRHDTHSAPEVAENFSSTPEMLLARTREGIAKLEARDKT
jgi:hypothetical protein